MMLTHHGGDGDNKARSPGRARSKPLKPFAQGMPECLGEPVVTNSCAFLLCTRGCGCADAPGIPCALGFWGEQYSKPGRETSREGGSVACVAWFELWNRNRCLCRPRARGDP